MTMTETTKNGSPICSSAHLLVNIYKHASERQISQNRQKPFNLPRNFFFASKSPTCVSLKIRADQNGNKNKSCN